MQNKPLRMGITASLAAALLAMPIQADQQLPQQKEPDKPQEFWLAACVVAVAGAAVAGIYIVSKKCQPKYYWIWDGQQPPTTWVGAATQKQCKIEGWIRVGGPYDRPEDAPPVCPSLTNRVSQLIDQPVNIAVEQASSDFRSWNQVYTESTTLEDFAYFPTNAGLFRLVLKP